MSYPAAAAPPSNKKRSKSQTSSDDEQHHFLSSGIYTLQLSCCLKIVFLVLTTLAKSSFKKITKNIQIVKKPILMSFKTLLKFF